MNQDFAAFTVAVIASGVRAGTPLLYAALGELFAERSGVINLGVEGIMLMGAMVGVAVNLHTGSAALAVLAAAGTGLVFAWVFAVMTVRLRVSQIPAGIGLIFLATGLSAFLGASLIGQRISGVPSMPLPILADIPALGPILFRHDSLVYLAFFILPASWAVLNLTQWGLSVRAVGDDPVAARQSGVDVESIRVQAVCVGGALAAIGGAYLSLAYTQVWVEDIVAGRGLIAVALVIFGRWRVVPVAAGTFLFGAIGGLQLRLQAAGVEVSSYLLSMLPYALTILVLAHSTIRAGGASAPRALGKPLPLA